MTGPRREFSVCECENHAFVTCTKGWVALVDVGDAPRLSDVNWCANKRYAYNKRGGVSRYMHREIVAGLDGSADVDHINGDGFDNRRENLRIGSHAQNLWNAKLSRTKAIKIKGVQQGSAQSFRAVICRHGQRISLGSFKTPEEAGAAYDAAAIELFGDFARTNYEMGLIEDRCPRASSRGRIMAQQAAKRAQKIHDGGRHG